MRVTKHDQTSDFEVIIIGAGPIGLTTGCALRHHGVNCLILEQRAEPKPNSRANNIWARPQELLESIGLRAPLAEQAYPVRTINWIFFGKPAEPLRTEQTESPFPNVLYSGQDVIETTLERTFTERGGQLRRGAKVTHIEQDESGVTITYTEGESEQAPQHQVRCQYLVGADGNEGTVRKTIGADFTAEAFPARMNRQIDARLSWRRPVDPDQLWFFYLDTGLCGVMPVWGGYHRIFVLKDDEGVPDRDPTLEEMEAVAREITGDDSLTLRDPIWKAHSRFKHGVASHFVQGRIFLAGDAGHFTLPIGGQGMNAGFHDAIGIAWRLAMALQGAVGPAILESYEAERRGEHARLDKQQAQGFRQVMYRGPIADAALHVAAQLIPSIGSLIQGSDDLQQISVRYPESPLNAEHMGLVDKLLHRSEPKAGERAPEATVSITGGKASTLFRHLYNAGGKTWGWALLMFDGGERDAGAKLGSLLAELAPWSFITAHAVLAHPAGQAPKGAVALYDLDLNAHRAYGLNGRPALVLIRPDGHIAFRAPANRKDLLLEYCRQTFAAAGIGSPVEATAPHASAVAKELEHTL